MTDGKLNNIVVIDDDPINNFLTEREINKYKLANRLTVFTKAIEGMEYIESACSSVGNLCPQLILLDKKMPVMDGKDLLLELVRKKVDITKKVKIVVISSDFRTEECEEFQKLGVVDCIEKPLIDGKLEELVEKVLYFSSLEKK